MIGFPSDTLGLFHDAVLGWYGEHRREFPWRAYAPDPYVVLVSETMLQQTQTSRVESRLPEFLSLFPNVYALAAAAADQVLRAWKGMGYNSRALRLRDCARAIVERHGGVVPSSEAELLSLPGIGRYTASAIRAFAYRVDCPVVDVNIARVYSRVVRRQPTTAALLSEGDIRDFAALSVPRDSGSEWHQALMDIGALYCTRNTPRCGGCPLADLCCSAHSMAEEGTAKKREPSFRGVPRRLWRGRFVDYLRILPPGEYLLPAELVVRVLGSAEPAEVEFAGVVFQALLRDGLIEYVPDEKICLKGE